MICEECNIERDVKDFFGNKCYKCVFKEKSKFIKKPENSCKRCGEKIPEFRTKYCSNECLEISTKEKKKLYWCKQIKCQKLRWD